MSKETLVVLRYDDFGYGDDRYDQGLIDLCRELGIPVVVGVVPGTCPEDLLSALSRCRSVEVAMHGLFHKATGPYGEVGGGDGWKLQLGRARQRLEDTIGRAVVTYIPPWNGIASGRITDLEEAGFGVVSGGPRLAAFKAFSKYTTLNFVPFSCGLEVLAKALHEGSNELLGDAPRIAVALWHPYNVSLAGAREAFRVLTTSPGIRVCTASEAAELVAGKADFYAINAGLQLGRGYIGRHAAQVRAQGRIEPSMRVAWVLQQFLWLARPSRGLECFTGFDGWLLKQAIGAGDRIWEMRVRAAWAARSLGHKYKPVGRT